MILKASKKSYFKHLWELLFFISLCFMLPLYFGSKYGEDVIDLVIQIAFIFFLLFCVPAIILFVRYVIVSRDVEVKYLNDKVKLSLNGKVREVDLADIDFIEAKLTLPVFFNGIRFLATDSFLYAKFHLNSGESFIVTSMLDNELLETLCFFKNKKEINRKLAFICWPPANKLKPKHN